MKPDTKEQKEMIRVYETWWHSYLNGDVPGYDDYLDDDFRFVGSTANEEFLSRPEATQFFRETADQMAGKAQLRNVARHIEPREGLVFITELADAYFLFGSEWTYYGRFRFTSVMKKSAAGWRFVYQHYSTPDAKAREGETLGTEQISRENQELRDAIRRRTAELEFKNRELEIETALERTRAQSMQMQHSEELSAVSKAFHEQLMLLGIDSAFSFVWLPDEGENTHMFWTTWAEGTSDKPVFRSRAVVYPMDRAEPYTAACFADWESGTPVHEHFVPKKDLEAFLASWSAMLEGAEHLKPEFFPNGIYYTEAFMKYGCFGIDIHRPLSKEEKNILHRFAIEFERAYTRFLDLQKAEAQAREAQIEAALERVRSRSMAMHKSEELAEVATVLYHELLKLEISAFSVASIVVFDEPNNQQIVWGSQTESEALQKSIMPLLGDPVLQEIYDTWHSGEPLFSVRVGGAALEKHKDFVFPRAGRTELVDRFLKNMPDPTFFHCAVFSMGYLELVADREIPEASASLLKRFAKVFEQTYTRFLDLQKAEAQAREAQVEAALERIRSQVTGMQESAELLDIVVTMRTEFVKLGHEAHYFWYMRWLPESYEKAMTSGDGTRIGMVMKLPRHIHGEIPLVAEWEQSDRPTVVYTMDADAAIAYVDKMVELGDFQQIDPQAPSHDDIRHIAGLTFVMARTTHGEIGYSLPGEVPDPPAEDLETLVRFAGVFDLAYRRFEDLKKSELQKREAEIELALERVRSRTMGMQTSDELREVVLVINEQLDRLDFGSNACNIIVIDRATGDSTYWVSGFAKDIYPVSYHVPYLDHPYYEALLNPWKRGDRYVVYEYSGQDKKDFEKISFAKSGFRDVPADAKKVMESLPFVILSTAYFSNGALQVIGPEALSEEKALILQRFARVFDQTYTRFLDLQKAEAQAREAQVETALERVRSRTMGMQTSDELQEAAMELFRQVEALGVPVFGCGFNIWDSDRKAATAWMAGKDRLQPPFKTSSSEDVFARIHKAAKKGARLFVEQQSGQVLKDHYAYMATIPTFREIMEEMASKGMSAPDFQIMHCAFFSQGYLMFISFEPVPDSHDIFKRFSGVFEQTYTRFLDLKKAEEQAREARIEAALERVRSRSMAMQTSEELKEVIQVIFEQLTLLNINAEHAGIVVDYSPGEDWHFWVADKQDIPSKITVPYLDLPWDRQYKAAKENGTEFFTTHLNFEEKNSFYQQLLPHIGGVTPKARDFYFKCPGLAASTVLQDDIGLYIENFSGTPYSDEENNILIRFGKVFQQTYTRFLDLKNLEGQAREAKIETALERVRARALAMQQPEELKDVAQVLRHEMGLLGVEELETSSIYINDWETRQTECWYAIKDIRKQQKVMVADHFALDLKATWVGREMLEFYESAAEQVSIIMKGKQRREWIDYCEAQSEPLRGYYGKEVPDRTYHLYKFSHGAIGVATAGELSGESWGLLRRAASVFSLAYSRFRDLTQARLDLQRLKEEKKRAEDALAELQLTQKQLVHAEKMASLGELTAGIAHEIQNPLNFVNNFSEVSRELLEEMIEELKKGDAEEADAIARDVIQNLEKIVHHGRRADGIVKGMLQHSRSGDGQKQPTDLNRLADEYLRLAYHGLRAKDKSFNANMETEFDPKLPNVSVVPQDIGRVLLNLVTNAFHAVSERKAASPEGYEPTVGVRTRKTPEGVEIAVIDNGNGIPEAIKDKIFQPFFTTKPTGQGTGLGLSMSYDIVTKGHGGQLKVASKPGEGTEFIVILPV